jgi:hypothetical protein
MKSTLVWIQARLAEPSTYAGLAALLGLLNESVLAQPIQAIGLGIAGLLAVVIGEKK